MKPRLYIYDIEIYRNLFMVSIKSVETKVIKTFTIWISKDEKEQINDLDLVIKFFDDKSKWLIGYNSLVYDNQVINYILANSSKLKRSSIKSILDTLYKQSTEFIGGVTKYKYLNYFGSIDVMRVGNIRKSLKLVAVNLKWHKIQDLPLGHKTYITKELIEKVKEYNINDILITEALYLALKSEITLRVSISNKYKINVMNESDSGMANKILEKLYSKATGLHPREFKELGTERGSIKIEECIIDKVKFKSKEMITFFERIKKEKVTSSSKLEYRVRIGNMYYKVAKGGLHSENNYEIYESTDQYKLIDIDVSSYYPMLMINYRFKPKHLKDEILTLLEEIVKDRLEAKRVRKELLIEKRKRELTPEEKKQLSDAHTRAEGEKIVVNSIYGKLGFDHHWLYDSKPLYQVTLNGQLMLLMLIEYLNISGFEVVYANTDGITTKVNKDREDQFRYICDTWSKYGNFSIEYIYFKKMIVRDVNNYLMLKESGEIKAGGELDKNKYKDLKKGFDKPIIPIALEEFFIKETPVEDTIKNHTDILDFCMAQRPGDDFKVSFRYISDKNELKSLDLTRTNRYLVSTKGGNLVKTKAGKEIKMVANEHLALVNDYDPTKDYNIKYSYYIKEAKKIIFPFFSKQKSLFE